MVCLKLERCFRTVPKHVKETYVSVLHMVSHGKSQFIATSPHRRTQAIDLRGQCQIATFDSSGLLSGEICRALRTAVEYPNKGSHHSVVVSRKSSEIAQG